jgi:hypothetical protein
MSSVEIFAFGKNGGAYKAAGIHWFLFDEI